jgi:hypothetical protein
MAGLDSSPLRAQITEATHIATSVSNAVPISDQLVEIRRDLSIARYLIDESSGEIFGVTCAHNLCRYDCNTEGITPDQLVELLPVEQPIFQTTS